MGKKDVNATKEVLKKLKTSKIARKCRPVDPNLRWKGDIEEAGEAFGFPDVPVPGTWSSPEIQANRFDLAALRNRLCDIAEHIGDAHKRSHDRQTNAYHNLEALFDEAMDAAIQYGRALGQFGQGTINSEEDDDEEEEQDPQVRHARARMEAIEGQYLAGVARLSQNVDICSRRSNYEGLARGAEFAFDFASRLPQRCFEPQEEEEEIEEEVEKIKPLPVLWRRSRVGTRLVEQPIKRKSPPVQTGIRRPLKAKEEEPQKPLEAKEEEEEEEEEPQE